MVEGRRTAEEQPERLIGLHEESEELGEQWSKGGPDPHFDRHLTEAFQMTTSMLRAQARPLLSSFDIAV